MRKSAIVGSLFLFILFLASTRDAGAETRKETAASYVNQGDEFTRRGEFELAIGAFNIALQFAPNFAPAYFGRGRAYEALREFSKAIADYTKTLEIVPGLTVAL
jgi:tetratricopeptide (TPR) repeat protein